MYELLIDRLTGAGYEQKQSQYFFHNMSLDNKMKTVSRIFYKKQLVESSSALFLEESEVAAVEKVLLAGVGEFFFF